MESSINAENSERAITNLSWTGCPLKNKILGICFPEMAKKTSQRRTSFNNLGLKISVYFISNEFDSGMPVEIFTFSLNQNNNKSIQQL